MAARDQVGFFGFAAGPELHIVDRLGLGDPLMSRLPAKRPWRIGHFERELPAGYIETLRTDQLRLQDPGLNEYYGRLKLITRGPLFSWERLRAVLAMNIGRDDELLAKYWREHSE